MKVHDAKCVEMKRRGAVYVAKQLAGKSAQEQLEYWQLRTKELLAKQASVISSSKRAQPSQSSQSSRRGDGPAPKF